MPEQVKYNRATRRWAMRKTVVMPVKTIKEPRVLVRADGTKEVKETSVAYLHPRKGWIGNKKAVVRAGYKYKHRRTAGR